MGVDDGVDDRLGTAGEASACAGTVLFSRPDK
jgi:hypothetical protein